MKFMPIAAVLLLTGCANFSDKTDYDTEQSSLSAALVSDLVDKLAQSSEDAVKIDEEAILNAILDEYQNQVLTPDLVQAIDWSGAELGLEYRFDSMFQSLSGPNPKMIRERRLYTLTDISGGRYLFERKSNESTSNVRYMYQNGRLYKQWSSGEYESAFADCDQFYVSTCQRSDGSVLEVEYEAGVWSYESLTDGQVSARSVAVYDKQGVILYSRSTSYRDGQAVLYTRENRVIESSVE